MRTPHSPKFYYYWSITIRLFSVISRILIGREGSYPSVEVYPTAPADRAVIQNWKPTLTFSYDFKISLQYLLQRSETVFLQKLHAGNHNRVRLLGKPDFWSTLLRKCSVSYGLIHRSNRSVQELSSYLIGPCSKKCRKKKKSQKC